MGRNFRPEDFVELIPVGQEIANKIFSSPPQINPSRATDETLLYVAPCSSFKLHLDNDRPNKLVKRFEYFDIDFY